MRTLMAAICLAFSFSCTIVPACPAAGGRPRLVVDVDMGLDDARALFALLADTLVAVEGVVVTEGSASLEKGILNALGLLEAAGAHGIPVYAGARCAARPPWRETADTLGGFAPRPCDDRAPAPPLLEELSRRLTNGRGTIDYLLLGPAGSLAEIASNHPEAFGRIGTIYVPATLRGRSVSAWNLTADGASSRRALEGARCIVLVDVSAANVAAEVLLAGTSRGTAASRFAGGTLASRAARSPHAFLCDELAAAFVLEPGIGSTAPEPFRLVIDEGGLSIAPDGRGGVRVARIEGAAAASVLLDRWERGPREIRHPASNADISVVDLLETFHGHLGPYVVLGYRMGRLALVATGGAGHFDISAEVHSFLSPPRSCLIDGVQLGAGCTLGKGNIEVHATEGPAYGIFTAKSGAVVAVRLRAGVPELVDRLIASVGVEGAGRTLLEADEKSLFEVQVMRPPAR